MPTLKNIVMFPDSFISRIIVPLVRLSVSVAPSRMLPQVLEILAQILQSPEMGKVLALKIFQGIFYFMLDKEVYADGINQTISLIQATIPLLTASNPTTASQALYLHAQIFNILPIIDSDDLVYPLSLIPELSIQIFQASLNLSGYIKTQKSDDKITDQFNYMQSLYNNLSNHFSRRMVTIISTTMSDNNPDVSSSAIEDVLQVLGRSHPVTTLSLLVPVIFNKLVSSTQSNQNGELGDHQFYFLVQQNASFVDYLQKYKLEHVNSKEKIKYLKFLMKLIS